MARTRRADYLKSNRSRSLFLHRPEAAVAPARRLLAARDAGSRLRIGGELLGVLASQTGIPVPELVVPDEHQPHRRAGGRIVYSLQGEYRRRAPSPGDPARARGGRPLGRIRILNRTPARGNLVRPSAFLNTLLHEFCHHHDAEALGLLRSFHTAGFYARLRHLRDQIEAAGLGLDDAAATPAAIDPRSGPSRGEAHGSPRGAGKRRGTPAASAILSRMWSIIRDL
jgi:hypothetical protein